MKSFKQFLTEEPTTATPPAKGKRRVRLAPITSPEGTIIGYAPRTSEIPPPEEPKPLPIEPTETASKESKFSTLPTDTTNSGNQRNLNYSVIDAGMSDLNPLGVWGRIENADTGNAIVFTKPESLNNWGPSIEGMLDRGDLDKANPKNTIADTRQEAGDTVNTFDAMLKRINWPYRVTATMADKNKKNKEKEEKEKLEAARAKFQQEHPGVQFR
jgi:hypothetical protein